MSNILYNKTTVRPSSLITLQTLAYNGSQIRPLLFVLIDLYRNWVFRVEE
jgi:hypothetical protein